MQFTNDVHPAFEKLALLPRVHLCGSVTLMEPLANLSKLLDGDPLYVKRDDLTPLAMGGNKVRQLEFYLGEAIAQSADTVLITGAVQSNFVRLTAAAACKLGLQCHVQLEERVANDEVTYRQSGNVLLDRVLGATIHSYPHGEDEEGADRNLEVIADELKQAGRKPYVIHLGPGHPSLGALGYVDAAMELVAQIESSGHGIRHIVVASGSGATHAGLLFGLKLLDSDIHLTGACVRRSAAQQVERIQRHCDSLAEMLEIDNPVGSADIILDDNFLAPGYGKAGEKAREAIHLAATREGLIVDPVYTAKALACAIGLARSESVHGPVLFVHTGGTPAIFGYPSEMLG